LITKAEGRRQRALFGAGIYTSLQLFPFQGEVLDQSIRIN
jgi:hypothetical protein